MASEMPTLPLATANAICSASQLGEVLGVSDRRVRQLTKDGVLKCARTRLNGMHYQLGESVQSLLRYRCELVTEECARRNGEYEAARARRMCALAEQVELELAVKKGKLHRSEDIEFIMVRLFTATKQHLLAIPSRVTRMLLPHVAAETGNANFQKNYNRVDDEIRQAMTEISELKSRDIISRKEVATTWAPISQPWKRWNGTSSVNLLN